MILRCLLRLFGIGGPRKEQGHSIISGAMSNDDIDAVLKRKK